MFLYVCRRTTSANDDDDDDDDVLYCIVLYMQRVQPVGQTSHVASVKSS